MKFFERRKARKILQQVFHEARHARHMREDIASTQDLKALADAEAELESAWKSRVEYPALEAVAEKVIGAARKIYPMHPHARTRENIEILIVALAVAMAFRAYFFQPFKIPTGSMQPTLYGIVYDRQDSKTWMDVFPLSIVTFLATGERFSQVKAPDSGNLTIDVRNMHNSDSQFVYLRAGSKVIKMRRGIPLTVQPGEYVSKGQVIASGRMSHGDHIFVNKVKYNFTRPSRGDVFVFKTRNIEYPGMNKDQFYIKRLAGLPGEKISILDRHLTADGRPVTSPEGFRRILEDEGYPHGYSLAGRLNSEGRSLQLGPDEYLPLGDNTNASLDGRYFGGVRKYDVVGPAFAVYWPFGKRWGLID